MRIQVSDRFFKTERNRAYSDWKLSFWRELFQNSMDVNATEVRITVNTSLDGCTQVSFKDNGLGMTREVLENVYFRLGETSKTGTDTIGGMGRARVMTCFAMQSYSISSFNYQVIGKGGDYEVVESPFTPGCSLLIETDETTVDEMKTKLKEFMQESRIRAKVILNGERVIWTSDTAGRHVRDLIANGKTFANVYVNKSSKNHRVLVRVNGTSMYAMQTSANAQIIVELEQETSRDVLTSNRDGMRWPYSGVLDSFVQEVAANTTTALRPRFARRTRICDNGGLLKIKSKLTAAEIVAQIAEAQSQMGAEGFQDTQKAKELAKQAEPAHWADTYEEAEFDSYGDRDFGKWLADNFGDIHVYDESQNETVRKVVPNYFPENWQPTCLNGKMFRKGGNIAKVLLMWKTTITYALECLLDGTALSGLSYGVGFVFADDRLAEHRTLDTGDHVFVVRPVGADGKLSYSVRDQKSLKKLMSLAKHEVTHVLHSVHNEDFSTMREVIDILFSEKECFQRMKAALDNVPNWEN